MSKMDKISRKKYMGVCSFESILTMRITQAFPTTVKIYVVEKRTEKRSCNPGRDLNPAKMNPITSVWFSMFPFR